MSTGETIKEVTQSITFYNVAGLIERDKQIYYVPLTADLMRQGESKICKAYKKLFDTVCPPPNSNYQNIAISRWNPEDRKLRVAGDSDTFRRGSSTTVLNYMVVERESHYVSLSKNPIYYGFFITGVRQAGANTVELDIEPDYWTNVFYWSNTNALTEDFNPFENLIANPFVERQHYDRVKVDERYVIEEVEYGYTTPLEINKEYVLSKTALSSWYSADYTSALVFYQTTVPIPRLYIDNLIVEKRSSNNVLITSYECCCIEVNFDDMLINIYKVGHHITNVELIESISIGDYSSANYWLTIKLTSNQNIHYERTGNYGEYINDWLMLPVSHSQVTDFNNMDIFVKTEEEYNYRQLFKDLRIPLTFDTYEVTYGNDNILNKIPAEAYTKKTVSEARTYLRSLVNGEHPDYQIADAICRACIRYLHIITKEQITYPTIIEAPSGTTSPQHYYYQAYYNKDFEIDRDVPSASQHLVIPFISETKGLEAFARYLNGGWISSSVDTEVPHGIMIRGQCMNRLVNGMTQEPYLTFYDSKGFSQYISNINDKYGYYIQSMFITPYCELSPSYDWEQDCIIFNGELLNEDTQPTSPLIRKRRKGTWWSGYTYHKIESPTKVIEEYDNAVISVPTLVMLPYNKIEKNSNQTEFSSVPHTVFEVTSGTYQSPIAISYKENSSTHKTYYEEDMLGYAFLVGVKGFEKTDNSTGEKYQQVLHLKYGINEETDLRYSFYEPILEMEPYSFYSLSMSEIETVLDRKRYYQMETGSPSYSDYAYFERTYRVPLFYNQAINTMYKVGVIPEYQINGISQRYYSEELMFVTTSGLTVKVDSYSDFMYVMSPQLKAQSHLAVYNAQMDMKKAMVSAVASGIGGSATGTTGGAVQGITNGIATIINQQTTNEQNIHNVAETIKAQKASAGRKADTFSQAGSDYIYELNLDEYSVMLNHYRIDELSYNSIAKMLERYGYFVNIYDNLNWNNRVGYNFIKLSHFDFNEANITLSEEQMSAIDEIFRNGVTLLHQRGYLDTSYHNYETKLELIED